jgi:hypothetical protein
MLDMVGLHKLYQARGVAALCTYGATIIILCLKTEYACNTALLIWMGPMMEYLEVTPHGRLNSST